MHELHEIRLLLSRSFAGFVSHTLISNILVHEGNQAVVWVLNAMISASRTMMSELRKLRALLHGLGIRIQAQWLPSVVNQYADALYRT